MLAVMASSRHNGPVSASTGVPAAIVHPVSGERLKAVLSATPSRDTVYSLPCSSRDSSDGSSVDEADCPTVCSGLGTRAKLTPLWSKIDMVQSALGCCWVMMRWNRLERHVEAHLVDDLLVAKHRHADGDDAAAGHGADEQVRIGRLAGRENLLDRIPVLARWRRFAGRQPGVQQLPAVPGGERDRLAGIFPQERSGILAKAVHVAAQQGLGAGQDLEPEREALHLGVEHEPHAAHHLHHAVEGGLARPHVVEIDDAGGEQDERKQGARHQKPEAQPEGGLWGREWGQRGGAKGGQVRSLCQCR